MDISAPAKINLYLKIIKKRDDGYHQIDTVFERISLCDTLSVEADSSAGSITCTDPGVPTGENSLLSRVISRFNEECGRKGFFRVHVEKNIPVGGGLGGGSSDAAALLKGLNRITGAPLDQEALLRISRNLGSDIPFFMYDCGFARGTGRGDIIEEVRTPLNLWHVLVTPPFGVSTAEVYGEAPGFGLTKDNGVDRMFSAFLNANGPDSLAKNLRNDLQAIVLRKFPVLKEVFCELKKAGARGVLLSGSGSTVFGIFNRDEVKKAEDELKRVFPADKKWKICTAGTCGSVHTSTRL